MEAVRAGALGVEESVDQQGGESILRGDYARASGSEYHYTRAVSQTEPTATLSLQQGRHVWRIQLSPDVPEVGRRFVSGFSLLASYTWSTLIDDVIPTGIGFPGEDFSVARLQTYYVRNNERSLAVSARRISLRLVTSMNCRSAQAQPFLI